MLLSRARHWARRIAPSNLFPAAWHWPGRPSMPRWTDPRVDPVQTLRVFAVGEESSKASLSEQGLARAKRQLERWQSADPSAAYLAALWGLMNRLRRLRRYADALQVWGLIRTMSEEGSPEVIRLARAIGEDKDACKGLLKSEASQRLVLLLAAEAAHCSRDAGDTNEHLDGILGVLRIDWAGPRRLETVRARRALLAGLVPLMPLLPPAVAEALEFWDIMGQWRLSNGDDRAALRDRLNALVNSSPTASVYRWCRLRVLCEGAGPARLAQIEREQRDWPAAQSDSPKVLADYFTALHSAESQLELRHPSRAVETGREWMLETLRERVPAVLQRQRALHTHLAPVLAGVGVELKQES